MQDRSSLSNRPELFTDRLLLRCPNPDDMDAIIRIVGDWEIARRLSRVPHPYGPADAMFFLENIVPAEWVWAVTMRGSAELIGAVGLTPEEGIDGAELGYWLSPDFWGQGIITEAARAVIAHGLDTLGLPGITSGYFEDNPASGRVLEKIGFVETGRSVRPCLAAGGDVPSVEMSLPPQGPLQKNAPC